MNTNNSPLTIGSRLLDLQLQTMLQLSSIQSRALQRMADATAELTRATLSKSDCASVQQAREGYGSAVADTWKALVEDSVKISVEQLNRSWDTLSSAPAPTTVPPGAKAEAVPTKPDATPAKAQTVSAKPRGSAGTSARPKAKRRKPAPRRKSSAAPSFKVLEDDQGARFQLIAADGEAVLTSRSYSSSRSARQGIAAIVKNASQATRYERSTSDNGERFFEIRAGNNRVLWRSGPYSKPAELEKDIDRLIRTVTAAPSP